MKKRILQLMVVVLSIGALLAAPLSGVAEKETPLLTIACLSDLHNQETLLTDTPPHIRGTITQTLTKMAQEEDQVDVILIGGDVTSDSYVSRDRVVSILEQVKAQTDALTPNVLWVTGNHDYNAGEGSEKYNSAPYYDLLMKDSVGALSDEDAYYETYQGEKYLLAYHYRLGGFDFIGINTSHESLAGGLQHTNYVYTDGTFDWVEQKLAAIGADKTVFAVGHLPIAGSNSLRADKGQLPASSRRMIDIFKNYPNLIYVYGHDHGGHDGAHIHEDTAQRVTQYDTHGEVIGGGEPAVDPTLTDAAVWKLIASGEGYLVQSVENGKYLGVASNLAPVSDPSVWKLGGNANGAYTLQNVTGGRFVHYSTNTETYSHGDASTLTFYEKITEGDATVYVEADGIKDGGEYVIAANQTRALTNKRSPINSERMAAIDVIRTAQSGVGAPKAGRFTVEKEGDVYRFVSENGGYLGYDGNLHVQPLDAFTAANAVDWTARAGDGNGALKWRNTGKAAVDIYCDLHYGGSGWSLGNATDTLVYAEKDGGWVAVTELNAGDVVFFVDASSGKALTAVSNGQSGSERRLVPADAGAGRTVIESVSPPEAPADEAQPGFITSFMGSMRYYSTSKDVHVGPNDSKVVQVLMIYVYTDRIVLQMKNYGVENAGEEILTPYVIPRQIVLSPAVIPGDVDDSGDVAAADALMALQAATGKIALTDAQETAADVDGQSGVTAADALLILQYATGKIGAFAAEQPGGVPADIGSGDGVNDALHD
ncbi:MAG: metallophosphoesterase [Acutalibacteraceae bacterium]|jgi:predicted MPP superfamily phosphohydrolase